MAVTHVSQQSSQKPVLGFQTPPKTTFQFRLPAACTNTEIVTPYLPMTPDEAMSVRDERAKQQEDAKVKRFAQYQDLCTKAKKCGVGTEQIDLAYKQGADLSSYKISNNKLTVEPLNHNQIKEIYNFSHGRLTSIQNFEDNHKISESTFSYNPVTMHSIGYNECPINFKYTYTRTSYDNDGNRTVATFGQVGEYEQGKLISEIIYDRRGCKIDYHEYYEK